MDAIRDRRIPLTCCPLSNLKLKVYSDLKEFDLKGLVDRGIVVTLNSDDPAYFGGYIYENYLACWEAGLCLDKKGFCELAKNSFRASFISDEMKDMFCAEVD